MRGGLIPRSENLRAPFSLLSSLLMLFVRNSFKLTSQSGRRKNPQLSKTCQLCQVVLFLLHPRRGVGAAPLSSTPWMICARFLWPCGQITRELLRS